MARLVRHTATGPYRIEPQEFPKDKPMFICGCGLSQNLPYCEGSHKACRTTETEGMLHVYDADRKAIVEKRPDDGR